jgi:6-phosphogluconate dehydrogenase
VPATLASFTQPSFTQQDENLVSHNGATMELGLIGLGRMGANMAQRLMRGGHQVVGFDPKPDARGALAEQGAETADSLANLVAKLPLPRTVWLMVPAGEITDATLTSLLPLLAANDIIIDGGNSYYKDTLRRAKMLSDRNISFIDCGTSGGIWGLAEGYSLMIGGNEAVVERLRPIFETLAPAKDQGWGRVGPVGSGHFTKMVHNGIEYGMMQAYAEGFAILQHKRAFDLDLHQIAEIWRRGSVVRSWLLDLTAAALEKNAAMQGIAPFVDDSGEGRWTVAEAIDLDVSAPVITLSLLERLRSRDSDSYSDKLLAAMRNQFGGHAIKTAIKKP